MADLEALLAVQDHDTTVDQLRHRRDHLPERAALRKVSDDLAALESGARGVVARRDEVAARQAHHESELASTEAKIADVERRLYSGTVSAPRELQAMQAEVESLRRHRGTIEDRVLEAMAEREPLDDELGRAGAERDRLDAEAGRLRAAIAEAEASIESELVAVGTAREAAAASVPAELTRLYEQLRAKMDGIGAARLSGGRCGGCHLSLPAVELDRIRREPPDALIRCDQCGRILIR